MNNKAKAYSIAITALREIAEMWNGYESTGDRMQERAAKALEHIAVLTDEETVQ